MKYEIAHFKKLPKAEHLERVYNFIKEKFGPNGYTKYWLDIEEAKKEQQKLFKMLDKKEVCKSYIAGLLDEITKNRCK